jgi:hypothetical protein
MRKYPGILRNSAEFNSGKYRMIEITSHKKSIFSKMPKKLKVKAGKSVKDTFYNPRIRQQAYHTFI